MGAAGEKYKANKCKHPGYKLSMAAVHDFKPGKGFIGDFGDEHFFYNGIGRALFAPVDELVEGFSSAGGQYFNIAAAGVFNPAGYTEAFGRLPGAAAVVNALYFAGDSEVNGHRAKIAEDDS